MDKLSKLAHEIVEELVDCDAADPEPVQQYLAWTENKLRSALQQATRRITELEEQRVTWASRAETLGSKLDAAEKRLATPVQLPVVLMGYQSDDYRDGFIHGVERSADAIRGAGFKCVGDTQ